MKKLLAVQLTLAFLFFVSFTLPAQIKVACIGNSITEGAKLTQPYPAALQQLLGDAYEVRNYGVGMRTLLQKGDYPYRKEQKYRDALAWNPDVVLIKLGTNDCKPHNWKYKDEFVADYVALINSFKDLPSKPDVFLCLPVPVMRDRWGIKEAVIKNEVIPAVQEAARQTKVKVLDTYTPLLNKPELYYDGIHPTDQGAALLAKEMHKALPKKVRKKSKTKV